MIEGGSGFSKLAKRPFLVEDCLLRGIFERALSKIGPKSQNHAVNQQPGTAIFWFRYIRPLPVYASDGKIDPPSAVLF
jgi:hypothetical protein